MAVLAGVDRSLQVLDALGGSGPAGIALSELAASVELDKPVVFRILATLRARGFAVQDPHTSAYALGPGFLAVADRYLGQDHLRDVLHAAATEVGSAVNELVHVGVPEQLGVRLIDKVEPRHALRIWSQVGELSHFADSPLGHAMLAVSLRTRADVERVYGPTPRSIDEIWDLVQRTRRRGWAEVIDQEAGTASVAVAVVRGAREIAAVSTTGPLSRISETDFAAFAARSISEALDRHLPPGLSAARPS